APSRASASTYPARRRASQTNDHADSGSLDSNRGDAPGGASGSRTSTNTNGTSFLSSSAVGRTRPASRPFARYGTRYLPDSSAPAAGGTVSVSASPRTRQRTASAAPAGTGGAGSRSAGSPQSVNAHADRRFAPASFACGPSRFSLSRL